MNNLLKTNRRPPWKLVLVAAIVVVAVAFALLGWFLALQPVTLEGPGRAQVVEIESGHSVAQIAAEFQQKGLVRHAWAFRLEAYLSRNAAGLKAGTYQLSDAMTTPEIVTAVATGKSALRKVTIPEGLTLRETLELLAKNEVASVPDLYGAASLDEIQKVLGATLPAQAGDAEGFLFPDTYFFAKNDDPTRVVETLLTTFKDKFYDPLWLPASTQKPWGSLYQVVILASIVEREARVDAERPLIAGVLVGRLKKGMALQADATVEYALGAHKAHVSLADLKVPSPYNTYLNKGLPPAPICEPGLPSLKAALNPQPTDNLFYFAPPGSKTHLFSKTFAEHSAKIKAARGR